MDADTYNKEHPLFGLLSQSLTFFPKDTKSAESSIIVINMNGHDYFFFSPLSRFLVETKS